MGQAPGGGAAPKGAPMGVEADQKLAAGQSQGEGVAQSNGQQDLERFALGQTDQKKQQQVEGKEQWAQKARMRTG